MNDFFIDYRYHSNTPIDHFQVFGERRCGTNFVHKLIRENLLVKGVYNYGWKHGYPTMPCVSNSGLIVVVVREPFSWLSSLHNRPFAISHRNLEWPEFLRKEWHDKYRPVGFGHKKWGYGGMPSEKGVSLQVDRHPLTGKRFANPIEMRNVKNAGFRSFLDRECNVAIIDYDSTNNGPQAMLAALSDTFGLSKRHHMAFRRPDHTGPKATSKPRVRKEDLSKADADFIRTHIDMDLEAKLGYALCFDA